MPKLISGLKLLSQSDPCVETFQQQTGEHVILTAGELHLEVCIRLSVSYRTLTVSAVEMSKGFTGAVRTSRDPGLKTYCPLS